MRQRTLVIAALAAVGVAIAIAVPLAIMAMQGSHELKFEYVKSGGIAGINERLAFDSMASFDSKTNVITFFQGTSGGTERQLSEAQVQEIREAIAGGGFFAMDSVYPPSQGPADYFSYSLTVTMDGRTHSVSWVDDFASAEQVPEGLKDIVSKIEEAYATASTS
ncbi:MAG: protealysin inhibitor emfourin [Nitrososphaera sp.]